MTTTLLTAQVKEEREEEEEEEEEGEAVQYRCGTKRGRSSFMILQNHVWWHSRKSF